MYFFSDISNFFKVPTFYFGGPLFPCCLICDEIQFLLSVSSFYNRKTLTPDVPYITDELPVTISPSTGPPDSQLPLDLNDIGYGGTWERFCDPNEIQEDFPDYPDHDLKRIRILICIFRRDGKVDQKTVPVFAAYRFCYMVSFSLFFSIPFFFESS